MISIFRVIQSKFLEKFDNSFQQFVISCKNLKQLAVKAMASKKFKKYDITPALSKRIDLFEKVLKSSNFEYVTN